MKEIGGYFGFEQFKNINCDNYQIKCVTDAIEKLRAINECEGSFSDNSLHTDEFKNKLICKAMINVIYSNETICGYVAFYANDTLSLTSYISMLAVHPNFQKRGIGKCLIQSVIKCSKNLGMKKIRLEVNPENYRAINLYKSFGFSFEEDDRHMFVII